MDVDFDQIQPRAGTQSIKWDYVSVDGALELRQHDDGVAVEHGLLPMWVADMDFRPAEPIVRALTDRLEGVLGYTRLGIGHYEAIRSWVEARHGWRVSTDWIMPTIGTLPIVNLAIQVFTDPGENFNGSRAQRALIGPDTEALVYDKFDTEVFAVFGNAAYDINDDIEFSVALRYDREEREATSLVPSPAQQTSNFIDYTDTFLAFPLGTFPCPGLGDGQGSPLNPAFVDFTNCTISQNIPDKKQTFEEVQPKIAMRWNVNDNLSTFASWGVGFKSGGFNNQGSQATIDLFFNTPLLDPVAVGGQGLGAQLSISDQFDKETSNAFEVGFKSNWADGRVNFEGSVYHTLVDDMQIFNFFVGPFGLLRVVSNIDEVSITGFETALSVQVTDALRIYGGGAVTNARIDKNSNRPQTVGNRVPYAPEYTFNFGGEYIKPTGWLDGVDFVGRVDYTAVGPTWFATTQIDDPTPTLFTGFNFGLMNHSLSQRDRYGLVNLRAGLQSDTWGIHGVVKNLMNENYLSEVIPAPEFGGSFIHPGNRRAWSVEVSYRF